MGIIRYEVDASVGPAVDAMLKIVAAQKKGERQFDRNIKKSKKQDQSITAMANNAVANFGKMVLAGGAFLLVGKGILAVMKDIRKEREEAFKSLEKTEQPFRRLAQIAGGDPAELKRLQGEVGKSVAQGLSESAAASLQFTLESLSLGEARGTFAQLGQVGADPERVAEGVGTLIGALGAKETGTPQQLLNKLLTAAAVSKTGVGEIGIAAARPAQQVSAIGGTDEELLATLAVLSRGSESASTAATNLKALAGFIQKEKLGGGKGLFAGIEALRGDRAALGRLGKQSEAFAAFGVFEKNREEILGLSRRLDRVTSETGGGQDVLTRQLISTQAVPGLANLQLLREQKALRDRERRESRADQEALNKATQERLLRDIQAGKFEVGGVGRDFQRFVAENVAFPISGLLGLDALPLEEQNRNRAAAGEAPLQLSIDRLNETMDDATSRTQNRDN